MIATLNDGEPPARVQCKPAVLDSANHFSVTMKDGQIVILRPKSGPMSREEALNMMAWFLALMDPNDVEFATLAKLVKHIKTT